MWEHDQPLTSIDGPPFEATGKCPQVYVQDILDNDPQPDVADKGIRPMSLAIDGMSLMTRGWLEICMHKKLVHGTIGSQSASHL
jgi:hypothetical protein